MSGPAGLAFNEEKTRVVTLDEGFDFLGYSVRRYRGKLSLIMPSTAAVRRIRERLRTEQRSLHGTNAQAVIARLNPTIRGWWAYYRTEPVTAGGVPRRTATDRQTRMRECGAGLLVRVIVCRGQSSDF